MSGFDTLVRDLVSSVVAPLVDVFEVDATHTPVTLDAAGNVVVTMPHGEPVPGAPVVRRVLWKQEQKTIRQQGGIEKLSTDKLVLLVPGVVVHERDTFLLPDGRTPSILQVDSLRATAGPYLTVVWLGASTGAGGGGSQ